MNKNISICAVYFLQGTVGDNSVDDRKLVKAGSIISIKVVAPGNILCKHIYTNNNLQLFYIYVIIND